MKNAASIGSAQSAGAPCVTPQNTQPLGVACTTSDSKVLWVSSFESMAALDGPGLRYAVFLAGCPLRCAYCHNPETWTRDGAQPYTVSELQKRLLRYKPYFGQNGGVTFSGGEPLMQAAALLPLVEQLQAQGVHVALDTAGSITGPDTDALLRRKPLLLLDVKMPDEARFHQYTGGHLAPTLETLAQAQRLGCEVWLRYVVVPGINDAPADVTAVAELARAYSCVTNITLLPYHTLGVAKYEKLGISYSLAGVQPPTAEEMAALNNSLHQTWQRG